MQWEEEVTAVVSTKLPEAAEFQNELPFRTKVPCLVEKEGFSLSQGECFLLRGKYPVLLSSKDLENYIHLVLV